MSKPQNMLDLYALRNELTSYEVGDELFNFQTRMIESKNARNSAISAWFDLMPEHEDPHTGSAFKYRNIFNALYPKGANIEIRPDSEDRFDRLKVIENSLAFQFPSIFEDPDKKKSFAHLIQILEESGTMGDYEDIADFLFKPYMMFDGGAETNLAFNRKYIESKHLDEDDFYDSFNYVIIGAVKEGKDVHFQYFKDGEAILKSRKEMVMLSAEVAEGGGSMWTGVRHPANAQNEQELKGMEVVVVQGGMDDRTNRKVVGRWVYTKTDVSDPAQGFKETKTIVPLQYNLDESIRVLSAYRRGNFMDIDNDEDIYDNVERWYKDGPSRVLDSVTSFTEEIVTADWWGLQPFNIPKFEYNEIVKPFWEKYGPQGQNLSKEAFRDKWEEERLQTTFTFEEKFFDIYPWLKNIMTPFRPSIGAIRYGTPRGRKTSERLGGRERRRKDMSIEKRFLLNSGPSLGEGLGAQIQRNWDEVTN